MKKTMSVYDFLNDWPTSRRDQFSRDALIALFDYYEAYEEDCGEEIEFDPVAICCEWTEYRDWSEVVSCYTDYSREEIQDYTEVIELDNGALVIRNF